LREEYRLKVFENRVLRRIFGLKRVEEQEAGNSCIMCFSPYIIRVT
jgi:hypothetical protein